jgi:hypothetical protein
VPARVLVEGAHPRRPLSPLPLPREMTQCDHSLGFQQVEVLVHPRHQHQHPRRKPLFLVPTDPWDP